MGVAPAGRSTMSPRGCFLGVASSQGLTSWAVDGSRVLVRGLLPRLAERMARPVSAAPPAITEAAVARLCAYDWPGNVRELENSIEHAVVLAKGNQIEVSDLPPTLHYAPSAAATSTTNTMMENEAKLLKEALDECGWNKKQAAQQLGISRNTLYRKLRKYQIKPPTIH